MDIYTNGVVGMMVINRGLQTKQQQKKVASLQQKENLSMILFVSRYCRRPESMHNNESELNLVY
jgi:hypothetical protein